MTVPRLTGGVAALTTAASLAFTGVAGAHAGQKSFAQTYPRASQLCTEVAQGGGPKHLRKAAPRVLVDCAALQSGFNTARAVILAGQASIRVAKATERAAAAPFCTGAAVHGAPCVRARHKRDRAIDRLELQRAELARAYFRTVEADRRLFWRSIRPLPGGRDLREDTPIPVQSD
jgi:hypothetical protein